MEGEGEGGQRREVQLASERWRLCADDDSDAMAVQQLAAMQAAAVAAPSEEQQEGGGEEESGPWEQGRLSRGEAMLEAPGAQEQGQLRGRKRPRKAVPGESCVRRCRAGYWMDRVQSKQAGGRLIARAFWTAVPQNMLQGYMPEQQ